MLGAGFGIRFTRSRTRKNPIGVSVYFGGWGRKIYKKSILYAIDVFGVVFYVCVQAETNKNNIKSIEPTLIERNMNLFQKNE